MVSISSDRRCFFQSDADLERERERAERMNYTAGDAVRLTSKALDLRCDDRNVYVAESGFTARRYPLDSSTGLVAKKATTVYRGHKGPVTSLALSSDGKILWTGSWDKTIRKWDVESGECLATLEGHSDFVKTLLVVGQTLYSGSADTHIRQWDTTTHECTRVLKEHSRAVEYLAASCDGQQIFSASSDRTIRRWECSTGNCVQTYDGHDTNVNYLIIYDDDILTTSADKTVRRWNIETGESDTTLQHPCSAKCVQMVGPYIITGASDGYIRVWDMATGKLVTTIHGHFDEVGCMAVKGNMLLSGSLDNTLRQWTISESTLKEYEEQAKTEKAKKGVSQEMTEDEERELEELMQDDD